MAFPPPRNYSLQIQTICQWLDSAQWALEELNNVERANEDYFLACQLSRTLPSVPEELFRCLKEVGKNLEDR